MSPTPSDKQFKTEPYLRIQAEPKPLLASNSIIDLLNCSATSAEPAPTPGASAQVVAQTDQLDSFCVMAIHIDPPADTNPSTQLQNALTEILQISLSSNQTKWFHWRDALYGCVIPDMDASSAMNAAHRLQKDLSGRRAETVSVGISSYPLLDYDRTQSLANACKALNHAAFFGPNSVAEFDAVSLNISGDRYYQDGNMKSAMAEYEAALQLDGDNVNVFNSLGVCLAKCGKMGRACEAFERAHQIDPLEAMAVYNTGVLHRLKEDIPNALAWFQKAYELDRTTFDIPFQIGKLLTDQKAWAQASPYLEKAIDLRSDHGPAFCLLGHCLAAQGQVTQAISAYKKAVKLNPNDAVALSALGCLYDAKGENADICLTFCRQSVLLSPDNGLFRFRLAEIYQRSSQLERALAEYEKAAALGYECGRKISEIRDQIEAGRRGKQCCA